MAQKTKREAWLFEAEGVYVRVSGMKERPGWQCHPAPQEPGQRVSSSQGRRKEDTKSTFSSTHPSREGALKSSPVCTSRRGLWRAHP